MPPSMRILLLLRSRPHTQNMLRCLTPALPAVGSRLLHQTHSLAAAAAAEAADSTPPESGEEFVRKQSLLWRLFKSGILLATAAAVGGVSYATYACLIGLGVFCSILFRIVKIVVFYCRFEPGYGSRAYDVEAVERKVTELKATKNVKISEDSGILDKMRTMVYTTSLDAAVTVADFYLETRKNLEDHIRGFAAPSSSKLLPDLLPQEQGTYTLVLDLNETLVYSDWKRDRGWRTFKRPGVEAFLEQLALHYELVIYSDQLGFYVDPVLEKLDQKGCIRYRLSRDATQYVNGKHYRDLAKLNRDSSHVIYLSGHATETTLQPENALPVKPWKLEADDTVLLDLLPFLEFVARQRPSDIRPVLASYEGLDIPTEFRVRTKEYQRKMAERKQQSRLWRGSSVSRPMP